MSLENDARVIRTKLKDVAQFSADKACPDGLSDLVVYDHMVSFEAGRSAIGYLKLQSLDIWITPPYASNLTTRERPRVCLEPVQKANCTD